MFRNDTIAGSWSALVEWIETTGALTCWAIDDDRLAGLTDVARDVVPQLSKYANPARADEILAALVRQAAADGGNDPDALLLVLHLLSDWVCPMATELADLSPGMVGVVISELTCQIHAYPWRRRSYAVAASLRWDTRHAILAEFRPTRTRYWPSAEQVLDLSSAQWQARRLAHARRQVDGAEDIDVADLLQWAVDVGVSRHDVALLVRTEQARADRAVHAADLVVAAEFGISPRTLYRRRTRTLGQLRMVSRDYVAAVA